MPVKVDVKNLGKVRGAETVQVYVVPQRESNAVRPVKMLADFNGVLVELGYEYEIHTRKGGFNYILGCGGGKMGCFERNVSATSSKQLKSQICPSNLKL